MEFVLAMKDFKEVKQISHLVLVKQQSLTHSFCYLLFRLKKCFLMDEKKKSINVLQCNEHVQYFCKLQCMFSVFGVQGNKLSVMKTNNSLSIF